MRTNALIIGVMLGLAPASVVEAQSRTTPVVLDVEGGETAFALSADRKTVWWLKGECRVELPIDARESTPDRKMSVAQNQTVTLGNRKLRMTQRFRFDIEAEDITISVYSSVRGGWAAVPIKRDRACEASACRSRTELPEC